jgi:uncharacterized membrane protein
MLFCKTFGLAVLGALCLLAPPIRRMPNAHSNVATEWSGGRVINLGGLPGSTSSFAFDINDAGRAVGASVVGSIIYATEWRGGRVINLRGLPGSARSEATSINDAAQVVGESVVDGACTPRSGAAAASSTWEACRAPHLALPSP